MRKYDVILEVKQTEDWIKSLVYRVNGVAQDNTGWTAELIVASSDNPPILATITEVDSAEGLVTFHGADGRITIWLKQALTTLMTDSEYAYDFFVNDGQGRRCLFSGTFKMFAAAGVLD